MKYAISTIIAFLLFPIWLFADVIYVPEDYPTIQDAINAASSGDSIIVASGIFAPATATGMDGITLIGNGFIGPEKTVITGSGGSISGVELNHCFDWEINGFEIYDVFQGVRLWYSDKIEVLNVYAHGNYEYYSVGISIEGCSNIHYHHCVSENNFYSGIWMTNSENVFIINNTILFNDGVSAGSNGILIVSYIDNLQIVNNIVAFNDDDGVESVVPIPSSLRDYNDVYANGGQNWKVLTPGYGCFSEDPLFTWAPPFPYFLTEDSPCIDTGDPMILDPDSTRSDIGAFYYQGMGAGQLFIDLLPDDSVFVVPPWGGTVSFIAEIYLSGTYRIFDGWLDLALPDGQVMDTFLLRENNYIVGLDTISHRINLQIPALAQAGNYLITGYVGDYPLLYDDWDTLAFIKQPFEEDIKGGEAVWTLSGWGETEYFTTLVQSPQNYELIFYSAPNPFNPETTIHFTLPEAGEVSIKAYDVLGREVAIVFSGFQSAGAHTIVWNAQELPSGIYFLHLSFNGNNKIINCLLLK